LKPFSASLCNSLAEEPVPAASVGDFLDGSISFAGASGCFAGKLVG